jgi:plasmid stabilization system protein ParE
MRELILLLAADRDIQCAYDLCEDRQEGRGVVFMRHLDSAFGQLLKFPESAPIMRGRYRRLLVPGFPYGIFYTVEPRGVIIVGVMDIRQNPESIIRRLH